MDASAPPTIAQQPSNTVTTVGRSASFTVVASGASSYQWQAGTTDIPGATSATYTIPSVVSGQNGAAFRVVVSNAIGSATSNSVTLTVNPLPTVTLQPAGLTVTAPASATFTAAATGGTAPLSYQWQRNGAAIPGATAGSYALAATSSADNGAAFSVVVTDGAGATATSTTAILIVTNSALPAPTLTNISPAGGPPGTVVELTGTNLSNAQALSFGGKPAAFFLNESTRILATVPGTAPADSATFQVTTPAGGATSAAFTVTSGDPVSGIAGYVYVPFAGGAPLLSPKPTPPSGYVPAAGAAVAFMGVSPTGTGVLTGGGQSTSAGTDGRYQLFGLPPGLGQIRVTPAGGTPLTSQVTVISGATVEIGAPTVTREAALALARTQVPVGTDPGSLFIVSPQSPLPPGVQVNQALGNADGDQDATTIYTVPTSQWFFYVDPEANQKFGHDVLYVYVDAASGSVTSSPAKSFPGLNGPRFYDHHDVNFAAADLASAPAAAATQASATTFRSLLQSRADSVQACCTPKTWAIILQGMGENAAAADVINIQTMFGNSGLPLPTPSTLTIIPPTGTSPKTQFKNAIANAKANAQPCDTILIYVSAHNSVGTAIELEHTLANGNPAPNDEKVVAQDINLQGVKTPNSFVILDTCNAGYIGKGIAQVNAGTGMTVLTATDADHGASYSNGWWNGASAGSSFTSSLCSGFTRLSGYSSFGQALNVAFNQTAISLGNSIWKNERAMNPQQFNAPPGNSHSLTPLCISADHFPGTTSCPQAFEPITLSNTGKASLKWTVTNPMVYVNLDVTSGTLAPGASVTIHPQFTCSGYSPGANSGKLTFSVTDSAGAVSNGPTDVAVTLTIH